MLGSKLNSNGSLSVPCANMDSSKSSREEEKAELRPDTPSIVPSTKDLSF